MTCIAAAMMFANYFFGPTDEILDRTVNLLGQNVLYRMGTSIESVNSRRKGGKLTFRKSDDHSVAFLVTFE